MSRLKAQLTSLHFHNIRRNTRGRIGVGHSGIGVHSSQGSGISGIEAVNSLINIYTAMLTGCEQRVLMQIATLKGL